MGINFRSGHPTDVYEAEMASRVARMLVEHAGAKAPLGTPGESFSLPDEMGWSWWRSLQEHAANQLGSSGAPQIQATDAWNAAYVDANITRLVLWPDGPPRAAGSAPQFQAVVTSKPSLLERLRGFVGLGSAQHAPPPGLQAAMDQMFAELGPRAGEHGSLQVGNLRALMMELNQLLGRLGVEPNQASVHALLDTYAKSDDRIDDDPEIQCLCHAWLTATHALARRSPLWLIK